MSADRLQRVGWGRLRRDFPERGPLGSEWVDASAVLAVRAASDDVHYRERCRLLLLGGSELVVFGRPDEVVLMLNGGTPG